MLARLWCFIVDHRYEVWQHFNRCSRRVVCDHCGGDWAMNDEVRSLVPWTGEFALLYEMCGHKIRERPVPQHNGGGK